MMKLAERNVLATTAKERRHMREQLIGEYADKIRPLLPLATRAFGARTHDTPAHTASREYTSLLLEFYAAGGSLLALSKELGVAYAGLRRRVITADAPVAPNRGHSRATPEETAEAVTRVRAAKSRSVTDYHSQLLAEYESGVSLGKLATALGLSGANPLYYGVHRARTKK
jgi:hypothetical protein